MLQDQLNVQDEQLKFNLKNAMENYNLQKENIDVATRVLQTSDNTEACFSSLKLQCPYRIKTGIA